MPELDKDETRIRELMAEQVDAMKAGDAERLVARYTADVVLFDLAPPLRQPTARALDAAALREWFAGFEGAVDYEVRDLAVTVGGDVAYCTAINRLSATPAGTTERFDLWFRATTGLRKVDGDWRVAHEHTSTPFYMDGSFGAAVDLTP